MTYAIQGPMYHSVRSITSRLAIFAGLLLIGCGDLPAWVELIDDAGPPTDMRASDDSDHGGPDRGDPPDMDPPDGSIPAETCNARDDDGDGTVDEDTSPMMPCREGDGRCAIAGVTLCRAGAVVCNGAPVDPIVETCNGEDDDCDGSSDEGFGLTEPCTEGQGVCATRGVRVCRDDGTAACNVSARDELRIDEVCDGIDNDCDGTYDEGDVAGSKLTQICVANRDGECSQGAETCEAIEGGAEATWSLCLSVVEPEMSDLCNGRDEDCDGIIDNGFEVGMDCDLPLLGGGICLQPGIERCTADGLDTVCAPRPEASCDGLDNNCDGVIDDGVICGQLIALQCRAWLGWTTREIPSPSDTWGTCPVTPDLAADLSCNRSGTLAEPFGQIDLFGDLDAADDRLGVRFGCMAGNAAVTYVADHCALYLGVAHAQAAPPDAAASWSACPQAPTGGSPNAACTSGDERFRPMPLPFDLDEDAVLGVAFHCIDVLDPERAAAMAGTIEVLVAWADNTVEPGEIDWNAICDPNGPQPPGTACVSTGGDGRFHAMAFTADVGEGDRFAIGLRPRRAPAP